MSCRKLGKLYATKWPVEIQQIRQTLSVQTRIKCQQMKRNKKSETKGKKNRERKKETNKKKIDKFRWDFKYITASSPSPFSFVKITIFYLYQWCVQRQRKSIHIKSRRKLHIERKLVDLADASRIYYITFQTNNFGFDNVVGVGDLLTINTILTRQCNYACRFLTRNCDKLSITERIRAAAAAAATKCWAHSIATRFGWCAYYIFFSCRRIQQ